MLKYPNLLISNNTPVIDIPEKVVNTPYVSVSKDFIACRLRGTRIEKTATGYNVAAWQRNIARFQKMDTSLPTVITMQLDKDKKITGISLAPEFTGSQGITCSYKYFNRTIKGLLLGKEIIPDNYELFKTKRVHCYHIFEVLMGLLTFFTHFDLIDVNAFDEIETGEVHNLGKDIGMTFTQRFNNGLQTECAMYWHDYKNKIKFQNDGRIININDLDIDFYLDDKLVYSSTLNGDDNQSSIESILSFSSECLKLVAEKIFPIKDIQPFHSMLNPYSSVGLYVQSIALAIYPNNYNYVQHAIRALQRKIDRPYCLGVINDVEEGKKYFPGFSEDDLY